MRPRDLPARAQPLDPTAGALIGVDVGFPARAQPLDTAAGVDVGFRLVTHFCPPIGSEAVLGGIIEFSLSKDIIRPDLYFAKRLLTLIILHVWGV